MGRLRSERFGDRRRNHFCAITNLRASQSSNTKFSFGIPRNLEVHYLRQGFAIGAAEGAKREVVSVSFWRSFSSIGLTNVPMATRGRLAIPSPA